MRQQLKAQFKKIIVLVCTIFLLHPVSAQISQQDSFALVNFFHATGGFEWNNNNGWLSNAPVSTWFGVDVAIEMTGDDRVIAIFLAQNNLTGIIPPSLNNLDQLMFLDLNCNQIEEFAPLLDLQFINYINVEKNALDFHDIRPMLDHPNIENIEFLYHIQLPIAEEIDTCLFEGADYILPLNVGDINGVMSEYYWFQNGIPLPVLPSNTGEYPLDNLDKTHHGIYNCFMVNPEVPDLILERAPIHIGMYCEDSLGGVFCPNRLIVKFIDGVLEPERQVVRDEFNAVLLETTMCDVLELWAIPDTVIIGTDTLIGPEEIKGRTREKAEVEEADVNHLSDLSPLTGGSSCGSSSIPSGDPTGTTKVAIIDTGMDIHHPELMSYVWTNPEEPIDMIDNDGNCIIDDIEGSSFVGNRGTIMDAHGHGTHVSGIVAATLGSGSGVRLIPVKAMDENGNGSVYSMASSMAYALEKGVKIINMSLGYSGVENTILRNTLESAQVEGAIVVTSSGNSGINNDTLPHYPSSFELNNIVSVAAINLSGDDLATYSNYGKNSVDLATDGSDICSTAPNMEYSTKSGTSMATAKVTGAIAKTWETYPNLDAVTLLNCLKISVSEIENLDTLLATKGVMDISAFAVCAANPPLAMEALKLEAQRNDLGVQIRWNTFENQNIIAYEIERRLETKAAFQKITKIEVSEKTASILLYEYQDVTTYKGQIYYRLKQIFKDGQTTYSEMITVNPIEENASIHIFPNPTQETVYVTIKQDMSAGSVELYHALGGLLSQTHFSDFKNKQIIPVDLSAYQQGIYFLSIKTGAQTFKFKVLKVI